MLYISSDRQNRIDQELNAMHKHYSVNKHKIGSILLYLICSCIHSLQAYGFDVGSYIDPPNEKKWHVEFILNEHTRHLETLTSNDNATLKENEIDPLVNEARTSIISIRTTRYFDKNFAIYFESGLFNDLKNESTSPAFVGVGSFFHLYSLGMLKLIPFASFHRTKSYKYQFIATTTPSTFNAIFRSHLSYYIGGILFVAKPLFSDKNHFIPYFGWKYSKIKSGDMTSIEISSVERREIAFKINDNIKVQSTQNNFAILGLSLMQNQFSIIRLEVQFYESRSAMSFNVGFIL